MHVHPQVPRLEVKVAADVVVYNRKLLKTRYHFPVGKTLFMFNATAMAKTSVSIVTNQFGQTLREYRQQSATLALELYLLLYFLLLRRSGDTLFMCGPLVLHNLTIGIISCVT